MTERPDRELLEAAAKAAGIALADRPFTHNKGEGALLPSMHLWNPLTDDGDALRLAVKLGLIVNANTHAASADGVSFMAQAGERDPYAATRRAIVCAAASLGAAQTRKSSEA